MSQIRERLFTREDLKRVTSNDLDSTFALGEDVWLWYDASVHVDGIIAGITYQRDVLTYDIAIPVLGTQLYIVTYGIRGGVTKVGDAYPGDDGGLIKKEDAPAASMTTTLH
jgi:hypothetical protein